MKLSDFDKVAATIQQLKQCQHNLDKLADAKENDVVIQQTPHVSWAARAVKPGHVQQAMELARIILADQIADLRDKLVDLGVDP